MENKKSGLWLRMLKTTNLFVILIPFMAVYIKYYKGYGGLSDGPLTSFLFAILFVTIYFAYGRLYDGFVVSLYRISEMVYSQSLAVLISDGLMFIIIWILSTIFPPIYPMILCFVCQVLISVLWCLFAHRWYFKHILAKPTLIIYDQREDFDNLIQEYGLSKKFNVLKIEEIHHFLQCGGDFNSAEVVFLYGIHSHERNIVLKRCLYEGITVYSIPRIGDMIMTSAKTVHLFHLPMLKVERFNPNPEYMFFKRIFDIVVSELAIIILSPVMAATAISIKLYDHGPILYKQCRLTRDGKKFNVLKFRSMKVDAEKDGVARLSTGENDDRITPIGHFIRSCRIDELPQLFNVLLGDMSIVGPRPERPEIASQYEKILPEFKLRLQAKAGLTGYAQVYGKYNTTPYDKLNFDLMYLSKACFLEDLRICFATIKILFQKDSTEGVQEGQTTAVRRVKEER